MYAAYRYTWQMHACRMFEYTMHACIYMQVVRYIELLYTYTFMNQITCTYFLKDILTERYLHTKNNVYLVHVSVISDYMYA